MPRGAPAPSASEGYDDDVCYNHNNNERIMHARHLAVRNKVRALTLRVVDFNILIFMCSEFAARRGKLAITRPGYLASTDANQTIPTEPSFSWSILRAILRFCDFAILDPARKNPKRSRLRIDQEEQSIRKLQSYDILGKLGARVGPPDSISVRSRSVSRFPAATSVARH